MFTLHKSVIAIINTLKDKDLAFLVKDFINYTPIDFVVVNTGAYRTSAMQNELFKKTPKVTNCDGYKIKSAHQSGLAVDLVPWVDGKPTWDLMYARALGASFKTFCKSKGYNVKWGGDWSDDGTFDSDDFDPYHFEGLKKI